MRKIMKNVRKKWESGARKRSFLQQKRDKVAPKGVTGMIEIVYKENKEQANGNEGYFRLPKNIRQVGDGNGKERIYLEDYVGTFLKKYFSAPEGRAAILFGDFKWADGVSYFFIRSAAAIHTMEPAPDHLVFDDAVWTEVHDVMEKYFKNQKILGWALSLPGYGEDLNEMMIKTHINHFGGNDKTLLRVNGQEREENFYIYEGNTLRSTGGFYIYYEKNEPMQSYLIDQNQNRSIESRESVPDRAVSDFRKAIEEKGEEPSFDHKKPVLYAMTACAAAFLLVTVVQKYGNFFSPSDEKSELVVSTAGSAQGEKQKRTENTAGGVSNGDGKSERESSLAGEKNEETASANGRDGSASGGQMTDENAAGQNTIGQSGAEQSEAGQSGAGQSGAGQNIAEQNIAEQNKTEQTETGQNAAGENTSNLKKSQQNPAGTAEMETEGEQNGTSVAQTETGTENETRETAAQVWQEYTVQKGDSLSKISEKYYGTMSRVKDICALNQIAVEDLIYAGQKIYLPK